MPDGRRPLGAEGMARLAAPALELVGRAAGAGGPAPEAVEVVVQRTAEGLTRFANSEVHQHVWTEHVSAAVRVVLPGGRAGVVNVSSDDPVEVARAADEAFTLARLTPEDPTFPGLAPPAPVETAPVDEATLALSPADRTAAVATLLAQVPQDYSASGAYQTGDHEL
ncbi:MAG: hypothetical protein GEV09_28220, partial [Pseudonocardiaceae bacterium]|nr:hypothetical protein [Pseudonocardiaceae bacterium]